MNAPLAAPEGGFPLKPLREKLCFGNGFAVYPWSGITTAPVALLPVFSGSSEFVVDPSNKESGQNFLYHASCGITEFNKAPKSILKSEFTPA